MPATTKVPLGASTTNRKWQVDVDTSATSTPTWTGVFGIAEFKPGLDGTAQDDSDFDSEGYRSSTKTALSWSLEFKVARKVTVALATAYDAGQEKLRALGNNMGPSNTAHVRWYEMEEDGPRLEAYEGYAMVDWSPDGGDMAALDVVSVKLTGQGKRIPITHPDAA